VVRLAFAEAKKKMKRKKRELARCVVGVLFRKFWSNRFLRQNACSTSSGIFAFKTKFKVLCFIAHDFRISKCFENVSQANVSQLLASFCWAKAIFIFNVGFRVAKSQKLERAVARSSGKLSHFTPYVVHCHLYGQRYCLRAGTQLCVAGLLNLYFWIPFSSPIVMPIFA
jgi:hypothetical protein